MARPTIDNIRSISNVAMANLWDVTLSGGPAQIEDLNFRAVSSGLPKANVESQEIKIRGHKVKVPGDLNYEGTITLSVVEDEDGRVQKFIKEYREKIWQSKTGIGQHKSDIESTLILRRLKKDGSASITYTIYGVYLEDYTPGELGENGEVVNIELVFSYDYFIEQ